MGFWNSNGLVREFSESQIWFQKVKSGKFNEGGELGENWGYNFTFLHFLEKIILFREKVGFLYRVRGNWVKNSNFLR